MEAQPVARTAPPLAHRSLLPPSPAHENRGDGDSIHSVAVSISWLRLCWYHIIKRPDARQPASVRGFQGSRTSTSRDSRRSGRLPIPVVSVGIGSTPGVHLSVGMRGPARRRFQARLSHRDCGDLSFFVAVEALQRRLVAFALVLRSTVFILVGCFAFADVRRRLALFR